MNPLGTPTPGPWRWKISLENKSIYLEGGRPTFDKTVMQFERWGMQGAQPLFNSARVDGDGDRFNIMEPAHKWRIPAPGREHHKNWFQLLTHPDAVLMQAAPVLLEALRETHIALLAHRATGQQILPDYLENAISRADAALKEATDPLSMGQLLLVR